MREIEFLSLDTEYNYISPVKLLWIQTTLYWLTPIHFVQYMEFKIRHVTHDYKKILGKR